MGKVAERFLDLGQAERGRAILREGEALAKQLPKAGWVGYARGAFAEELVQVDLEAALALTKDLADAGQFDRHHGNIAHELAGRDPAQAERVLTMVKDQRQRDQYTVRVVYRMAPLDLGPCPPPGGIDQRRRPQGVRSGNDGPPPGRDRQGLGAGGARKRLRIARAFVPRSARRNQTAFMTSPPSRPFCCRSPSGSTPGSSRNISGAASRCDSPTHGRPCPGGRHAQADVLLAMMLARYDRAIARSLVEPLARGGGPAAVYFSSRGELYAAAAVIDPKWAVALVEALPDDPDLKIQSTKNSARLAVANRAGPGGRPAVPEPSVFLSPPLGTGH